MESHNKGFISTTKEKVKDMAKKVVKGAKDIASGKGGSEKRNQSKKTTSSHNKT